MLTDKDNKDALCQKNSYLASNWFNIFSTFLNRMAVCLNVLKVDVNVRQHHKPDYYM